MTGIRDAHAVGNSFVYEPGENIGLMQHGDFSDTVSVDSHRSSRARSSSRSSSPWQCDDSQQTKVNVPLVVAVVGIGVST